VHHGRRADAIVKNMLQHSREGSGEHRAIDINALVEESLNLAWHGARAETQGFEIKLKQSFDPSAGAADVFPQDIRRALLNLIANGFYAATRRRAETNGDEYEATLTASTKDLGDRVEIRIRDNGTGMTPDVKERMFNPFFTTKPTKTRGKITLISVNSRGWVSTSIAWERGPALASPSATTSSRTTPEPSGWGCCTTWFPSQSPSPRCLIRPRREPTSIWRRWRRPVKRLAGKS